VNKHRHFAQWPGRLFKIPSPAGWQVVVTNPTHLDDLRKVPEHILSADKVVEEVCCNSLFVISLHSKPSYPTQSLQSRFTLNHHVMQNRIQVSIIRTRLTKETPGLVADVYDEVVEACNQYIPVKDGIFVRLFSVCGG
jgi:septum formation topological specificity factor MinE